MLKYLFVFIFVYAKDHCKVIYIFTKILCIYMWYYYMQFQFILTFMENDRID